MTKVWMVDGWVSNGDTFLFWYFTWSRPISVVTRKAYTTWHVVDEIDPCTLALSQKTKLLSCLIFRGKIEHIQISRRKFILLIKMAQKKTLFIKKRRRRKKKSTYKYGQIQECQYWSKVQTYEPPLLGFYVRSDLANPLMKQIMKCVLIKFDSS